MNWQKYFYYFDKNIEKLTTSKVALEFGNFIFPLLVIKLKIVRKY